MILRILPLLLLVASSVFAQSPKLDSLQRLLQTLPQDTNRIKVNTAIFRSMVSSNPKKAMPYVQEALQLSQKLHLPKWEASSYSNLGIGYDLQNDYVAALDSYLKGLKIAQQHQDYTNLPALYNNMANTYKKQNDLDGAMEYYKKSLELKKKYAPGEKLHIAYTLNNIAVIYDGKKDYIQAMDYYLQSLELKQESKDKKSIAQTLSNIGVLYLRKNYPEKCIEYQLKAIPMFEEVHEKIGLIAALLPMVNAYDSLHNLPKAIEAGKKAFALSQQVGAPKLSEQASRYLSELYEKQKDYKKAYYYLSLRNSYYDSLTNEEKVRDFERMKSGYELEKKDLENQTLLKDKKIREAENAALAKDQQVKIAQLQLAELSLSKEEELRQMEKIQFDRKLEAEAAEKIQLRKDKQLQTTELKLKETIIGQQRLWGILIGLIVLLLGVLSMVFYKNNQQKKKDNALLNAQKEAIEQQNMRLEELNAIKDKLFSIISHDFRSPLHSLQGIVELMHTETLSAEETKRILPQLSERLGITLHLLENLLHWAKNQMKGMTVNATTFDIKPVVEESVRLVQIQLAKKQIELQNQLHAMPVHADREMINLVIRNLVSNAVKFTKPRGQITIQAQPIDRYVHISVQDTGLGIAQENLERLFTAAATFTTPGTANEKGTGLGLNLCKDFVVKNGGDIWVESEPGKGTKFTFTIPVPSPA